MLGWIFRNKSNTNPKPALAVEVPPPAPARAPAVDWQARLAQARGDDEALLALARSAGVTMQIKLDIVEALQAEAALKAAEAEFRNHDRRVHQLAKRRLQAVVAQRQAREKAERLIESARSLAGEPDAAVNRGVELDQAWQALDAALLAPAQRETFAALTAQLAAQARRRADAEAQRKRWLADAREALLQLRRAGAEAAAGTQEAASDWLASAVARAQGLARALPDDATPAIAAAERDLLQALATAAALVEHLAALQRLQAEPPAAAEGTPVLPELPALPDAELAALLQARHARWQQTRAQALRQEQQAQQEQQQAQRRLREHEQARAQGAPAVAWADAVARAEAALDAGQLVAAQRLLGEIDAAQPGADPPAALRARIDAAQARLAQLRGWQHWAGARARDELVLQAEALAAATVAGHAAADASEAEAEVARLSIRQRAEVIASLRARWKEIDRVGGHAGAGGRALWQRFDAALNAAHEPVAAHAKAQRALREANLAARGALLEALETASAAAAAAPAEPRALAAALDRFHVEWRKLGPPEHTVPREARAALAARVEAALRQAQAPLQAARQQAGSERQSLLARARALDGGSRDLVLEVRALQAEWQQHAKSLPLARADEQALWNDFKAAIDAAFAAREAAFSAREAELEAHAVARAALIERLRVRPEDSAAAQRQALAETDAAWQRCGPAPRARAAALEAEYRAAREALRQWLDDSAQRAWQAGCDALEAKLALCLAREDGAVQAVESWAGAWQALPPLPGLLEDALRQRAGLAPAGAFDASPPVDELLLQIETAWELPTPPAFEAARRERKLLAMKATLEGRRGAADKALSPDAVLARLLGRTGLDAGQRERLAAVLAGRRRRGPVSSGWNAGWNAG
jgi:hypothetical protein